MSGKNQNDYERRIEGLKLSYYMQPTSSPGSFALPIALTFSDPLREEMRPRRSEEEEVQRLEALVEAERLRRERRSLARLFRRLFRYAREAPMEAR